MFRWLASLRFALRSLISRSRVEQELDEEMQFHLEQQMDEGLSAGLSREEARYAALRAMGAVGNSKEESRDLWSARFVSDFVGDLRYAERGLRRNPGFAVLAIVVMAVGIGANTAVFSVVNGVLLKPLPYPGADRIVTLSTADLTTGQTQPSVTIANFRDWRDQSSAFEAMSSYRSGEFPMTTGTTAEYGLGATVDAQFFRTFDVKPIIGRTFAPEEMIPDNEHPVALISHAYWQARFGGDVGILHRTVRVGSLPRTIVGVMPPGFHYPGKADLWLPRRPVRPVAPDTISTRSHGLSKAYRSSRRRLS